MQASEFHARLAMAMAGDSGCLNGEWRVNRYSTAIARALSADEQKKWVDTSLLVDAVPIRKRLARCVKEHRDADGEKKAEGDDLEDLKDLEGRIAAIGPPDVGAHPNETTFLALLSFIVSSARQVHTDVALLERHGKEAFDKMCLHTDVQQAAIDEVAVIIKESFQLQDNLHAVERYEENQQVKQLRAQATFAVAAVVAADNNGKVDGLSIIDELQSMYLDAKQQVRQKRAAEEANAHEGGAAAAAPNNIKFGRHMVSQEWDPMLMDLDAENVPYKEAAQRPFSEKRSFKEFGKAIHSTFEGLKRPPVRRELFPPEQREEDEVKVVDEEDDEEDEERAGYAIAKVVHKERILVGGPVFGQLNADHAVLLKQRKIKDQQDGGAAAVVHKSKAARRRQRLDVEKQRVELIARKARAVDEIEKLRAEQQQARGEAPDMVIIDEAQAAAKPKEGGAAAAVAAPSWAELFTANDAAGHSDFWRVRAAKEEEGAAAAAANENRAAAAFRYRYEKAIGVYKQMGEINEKSFKPDDKPRMVAAPVQPLYARQYAAKQAAMHDDGKDKFNGIDLDREEYNGLSMPKPDVEYDGFNAKRMNRLRVAAAAWGHANVGGGGAAAAAADEQDQQAKMRAAAMHVQGGAADERLAVAEAINRAKVDISHERLADLCRLDKQMRAMGATHNARVATALADMAKHEGGAAVAANEAFDGERQKEIVDIAQRRREQEDRDIEAINAPRYNHAEVLQHMHDLGVAAEPQVKEQEDDNQPWYHDLIAGNFGAAAPPAQGNEDRNWGNAAVGMRAVRVKNDQARDEQAQQARDDMPPLESEEDVMKEVD